MKAKAGNHWFTIPVTCEVTFQASSLQAAKAKAKRFVGTYADCCVLEVSKEQIELVKKVN